MINIGRVHVLIVGVSSVKWSAIMSTGIARVVAVFVSNIRGQQSGEHLNK